MILRGTISLVLGVGMIKGKDTMIKALKILKKELTNEEFAIYFQQIVKRSGDSVKELSLEEFVKMIREMSISS